MLVFFNFAGWNGSGEFVGESSAGWRSVTLWRGVLRANLSSWLTISDL
jgi:hypothetical protein